MTEKELWISYNSIATLDGPQTQVPATRDHIVDVFRKAWNTDLPIDDSPPLCEQPYGYSLPVAGPRLVPQIILFDGL